MKMGGNASFPEPLREHPNNKPRISGHTLLLINLPSGSDRADFLRKRQRRRKNEELLSAINQLHQHISGAKCITEGGD